MKAKVTVAAIALLIAAAGIISASKLRGSFRGPRLRISPSSTIHLLTLLEDESTESHRVFAGTYSVANAGTEVLEFSTTASCGCSRIDPRSGSIPPGKEVVLRLAMELENPGTREANI